MPEEQPTEHSPTRSCETKTTKKHNLIPAKRRIHEKESEKVEKHPDWKREISTYYYYYYYYYYY